MQKTVTTKTSVIPSPKASVKTVVIQQKRVQKKNKNKQRKRNAANKQAQGSTRRISETEFFVHAMQAPDLIGPFRQPRFGGSDRTGLAYDHTIVDITGSGTNLVQGVQGGGVYAAPGSQWAVAGETTAIGSGTALTPSSQFPNQTQIADIDLVSECITAEYLGNPLNVAGEVIFGSIIPLTTTATYGSLYVYPGIVAMPIARLINEPIRVSFRKLSDAADEFTPLATGTSDCDLPMVFTSGLPSGQKIRLNIYRAWEYRSTTAATNVIPYERVGQNFSSDTMAYQDARAFVAEMPAPVTPALGETEGFLDMLGFPQGFANDAYSVGSKLLRDAAFAAARGGVQAGLSGLSNVLYRHSPYRGFQPF